MKVGKAKACFFKNRYELLNYAFIITPSTRRNAFADKVELMFTHQTFTFQYVNDTIRQR
jgi:hypothetical protein